MPLILSKSLAEIENWSIISKILEDPNSILEIHQNTAGYVLKVLNQDLSQEVARLEVHVASELNNTKAYYPYRSDVHPGFQKKGIWYFCYRFLIDYLAQLDSVLLSGSLNGASKKLWNKLKLSWHAEPHIPYMGYKYGMRWLPTKNLETDPQTERIEETATLIL